MDILSFQNVDERTFYPSKMLMDGHFILPKCW